MEKLILNMHFSVCMSVYNRDNAEDFIQAFNSICNQTIPPSEIILVEDGPISSKLENIILELEKNISCLKVIRLKENVGHACSRQTALKAASNELVAVMDSDDVSLPDRFEKQLRIFNKYPNISVVGGLIHEFVNDINNIVGIRVVPKEDSEIREYLKSRCPMNLVTVMFKKHDIMNVGGYLDWYCEEDYYLWIRLAIAGYKFYNIQENLVNVRVGEQMYQRRGGFKYFKSESKLQKYMYDKKLISFYRLSYNILIRFIVQVLLPNKVRGWVFQKFARK